MIMCTACVYIYILVLLLENDDFYGVYIYITIQIHDYNRI